jgi:methyl-accepting chemotaxis protein
MTIKKKLLLLSLGLTVLLSVAGLLHRRANINIVTEISMAVQEQSATSGEISQNVVQASEGIAEVNENVAQTSAVLAEIAQNIAETSSCVSQLSGSGDEIKKTAQHLADQVSVLNDLTSRFKK